jgi:hypothetical protein
MNAPIPEDALAKVKEAVARGQKIEAIRLYRECTGADLAAAKAAVEQLDAELRAAEPDSFAAAARSRDVRQPPVRLVGGVPLGCLLGATPFVVFGAVFLVAGVRSTISEWAANARAVSTQGTVVRHDNRLPPNYGHSNTQCRAVVSYEVAGQSYEVFGPIQYRPGVWGWPQAYPIGETVTVLYDPDRPEAAASYLGHCREGAGFVNAEADRRPPNRFRAALRSPKRAAA